MTSARSLAVWAVALLLALLSIFSSSTQANQWLLAGVFPDICNAHPELFACVLVKACAEAERSDGWCDPQSLLATACTDPSGPKDSTPECINFATQCKDAKKAHDPEAQKTICGAHRLNSLPSTQNVGAYVKDICAEMPGMKACKAPTKDSEVVRTYIALCSSMPSMSDCKPLAKLCKEVESKNGKSPSTQALDQLLECEQVLKVNPPEMRMYLHATNHDYVVFYSWVPHSDTGMFFSCLLIFFLSALTVWVRGRRLVWSERQSRPSSILAPLVSDESAGESRLTSLGDPSSGSGGGGGGKFSCRTNTSRAGWALLVAISDMFFMLVAMSFNFWLIVAVVFGAAFGHFLWGHRLVGGNSEVIASGPCSMCT